MPNTLCVTIDAGVLAVPNNNCTEDNAFLYIETLLNWSMLLDEPWVSIYLSENASEALGKDGSYPLWEPLKQLFKSHGIVEYDVKTVMTIINKLLQKYPSFEENFRLTEVLSEHLETDPDIIGLTNHSSLQSNLKRCITLIAVLRKHCSQPLGGHSLILREAPGKEIHVKAHIIELEHSRDDIPSLPWSPEFFEVNVSICDDFSKLISSLDESAILADMSDDDVIKLAVRIALFKDEIVPGASPDWRGMIVPVIGSKFRMSCQKACADQGGSIPKKILRSIVETIKRRNLPDAHALRTEFGGSAQQQMRGSDKAMRRDIDDKFRLHYWECANEKIELASVVPHNDFSIPV